MTCPRRLLIVHPDPSARSMLTSMLQSLGHRVEEDSSEPSAARRLEQGGADLVMVGSRPAAPESSDDAMEFLTYLRRKHPGMPVLLLCHEPGPHRTREALNRGADSVLRFPLPASQLRAAVEQAIERHAGPGVAPCPAPAPPAVVPAPGDRPTDLADREFVGEDLALLRALELAEAIAPTRAPVMIVGEPGTGKRLLARHLHRRSGRRAGQFVEVHVQGARESALEQELFGRRGHGPGEPDRPGKIAQAHGGTLYLDDASSLPLGLQTRLARLLRDGEFEPVGSSTAERSDCRLIVGSLAELGPLVEQGRFRPELFYALCVVALKLPPLRQRGGDIGRLAGFFAAGLAAEQGHAPPRFSPEALRHLEAHDWPGNVLELRAVATRAALLARSGRIEPQHLDFSAPEPAPARIHPAPARPNSPRTIRPLKEALEVPEKQFILEALRALNWNRQETARMLDINRTTLYKKMKKYDLLYDEPVWTN